MKKLLFIVLFVSFFNSVANNQPDTQIPDWFNSLKTTEKKFFSSKVNRWKALFSLLPIELQEQIVNTLKKNGVNFLAKELRSVWPLIIPLFLCLSQEFRLFLFVFLLLGIGNKNKAPLLGVVQTIILRAIKKGERLFPLDPYSRDAWITMWSVLFNISKSFYPGSNIDEIINFSEELLKKNKSVFCKNL